ncbi:hypothetical protein C8F04DRAFT_1129139 [Mycena alexandri]|uniref:Uncharacterized protein n=1 Tax=Mycena alexandri TaxID=1745969 RepID=A0AAD6WUG6_9AGAR|nr:hypothetical protein C8F04DRAFT_1129139 [Mycena alexandri]
MSAKSRAIGDTENKFQAALMTYTKAGNKTAAMRRLWNAAYEIGKMAAEVAALRVEEERLEVTRRKESNRVEEERIRAFTRGKAAGFEAGRDAALTADFEVSFASGKIAGRADGVEIGREPEEKRWRDAGHSEDGTCRKSDEPSIAASAPPPFPTHVPGAFDWADDAESLPIHTVMRESHVRQPRDFSALRSSATNPFQTLQRRHARCHGNQARSRRPRQLQSYSTSFYTDPQFILPHSTRPALRSKPGLSFLGLLVWLWTSWHLPQASLG